MARSAMPPWFVDSPDPETTHALAALLGRSIGARGLAIGLIGPLGSGKTAFVKGLAEGLGLDPRIVSSPTFVLAQQYPLPEGPERLHHLDFYRLASEAELEAIGFLDLLGPGQVLAVEWLDRFPEALGPDRLEIVFVAGSERDGAEDAATGLVSRRRIAVTAFGDEATRVLRDWTERWARYERARGPAEGAEPPIGFDWRSLLALLFAGGLGLDLVVGGMLGGAELDGPGLTAGRARAGCVALTPEHSDAHGEAAQGDALGALRVRCLEGDAAMAGQAAPPRAVQTSRLEGMARLLDGGTIDPNTASRRLLASLPGIGPGRAGAIEAERAKARFRSVRELERVSGIGPKTRARLEPFLTVDSEGPAG